MMTEFEDHDDEGRRRLLQHLESLKTQNLGATSSPLPKANWLWRWVGRIWMAYVRLRYGRSG